MAGPVVLAERYELISQLGRGAMGRVWLAHDRLLDRSVAVKEVLADASDEDTGRRAMREARLAGRLSHPNAVAVYDLVVVDDRPHVVMEYVNGHTLAEALARGTIQPGQLAEYLAQIAGALAAAHQLGIVHRDVKPANILIDHEEGIAKLADFGIARSNGSAGFTRAGLVIGTLAYMAPEVAQGATATPAADVWALGATAFAATEGHAPYQADNDVAQYARLISQPPPRPERAGALAEPILRMMQHDLHRRPPASTVRRELTDIARRPAAPVAPDRSHPAPPGPPPAPAAHPAERPTAPRPAPPAPRPAGSITPSVPAGPLPRVRPLAADESRGASLGELLEPGEPNEPPAGRPRGPWLAIGIGTLVGLLLAALLIFLLNRHDGSNDQGSGASNGATTPLSSAPTSSTAGAADILSGQAVYAAPGDITLFGPAGWVANNTGAATTIRNFTPAASKTLDENTYFRIGIGNSAPAATIAAEAQDAQEFLTGTGKHTTDGSKYSAVKIVSSRVSTFLGAPSVDIEFTGTTAGGSARHAIERLWIADGKTRIIQVNSPAGQWDPTLRLFTQLTTTCKIG